MVRIDPPDACASSSDASTPRAVISLPPLASISLRWPRENTARTIDPPLAPTARNSGVWMVSFTLRSPCHLMLRWKRTWSVPSSTTVSTSGSVASSASMCTGLRGPISMVAFIPAEICTAERAGTSRSSPFATAAVETRAATNATCMTTSRTRSDESITPVSG